MRYVSRSCHYFRRVTALCLSDALRSNHVFICTGRCIAKPSLQSTLAQNKPLYICDMKYKGYNPWDRQFLIIKSTKKKLFFTYMCVYEPLTRGLETLVGSITVYYHGIIITLSVTIKKFDYSSLKWFDNWLNLNPWPSLRNSRSRLGQVSSFDFRPRNLFDPCKNKF